MVRREGTRFGINTSHRVKRLPFPYKNLYAQQNVVIETRLDAEDGQSKKRANMALRRQLQKDTFNTQPDETSDSLRFSLNKAKRWEVIEDIKEADHHSNHYIIREHHMLDDESSRSCIGVFDSSAQHSVRSPKKKYAKAADLTNKDQSEKVKEDADFGKKNCKRSRKRRARQEEEETAETVIQYDVSLTTPRETYQTYSKSSAYSGCRQRNSRNRSKKLQQCKMNDMFCDGLWQISEYPVDEEEEEYYQEDTEEPYQVALETIETGSYDIALETLVGGSMSLSAVCKLDCRSPSQSNPMKSTKDRVFPIDKKDAVVAIHPSYIIPVREKRAAKKNAKKHAKKHAKMEPVKEPVKEEPLAVVDKPSFGTVVQADDITEENLRGRFGDCFIEGKCMPRRFAINISESVIQHLASNPGNAELSSLLQQTGHHIFTIVECSLDPWLVMRNDQRLVESIRLKLSGVNEGQETLADALSDLESDSISDMVNAISQAVAYLPDQSYLIEKALSSHTTKPALVVDTVKTTLGWHYHTTNANKAVQHAMTTKKEPDDRLVSYEASNACESCSICCEELNEERHGTALIACNHWFCDECWKNHLMAQINKGSIHITCPEYKCTMAVDKVTLMSLVSSTNFSCYHGNQTNSALMLRSELHWCPNPYCGRLLSLSHPMRRVAINCECGTFWCSGCKEEAHWPATCQQAKLYRQNAKDMFKKKPKDEMIRSVDTKRCPRCRYPIEKHYGCNYMNCICGYDFCWECGKDFSDRHYHCRHDMGSWRNKVYHLLPENEDIVEKTAIELAILHHKERTSFACHRRIRKVRTLAPKMLKTGRDQLKKESENASSVPMVTSESFRLKEIKKMLIDVANFLSEAEFVLEHLEILLSCTSHGCKRVLYDHKSRLTFIAGRLHKVFKQGDNLTVADIQHLFNCGKDCLRWIALSSSQLSNSLESTEE